MTFGKSFSRGGAFPLEAYEIWTDYDALVAYAANTDPAKDPSYIGQKVAYVDLENNKVTHYGIEIDGTLKELGCSPVGDSKSIVVAEDGTISLKGIDGLVFERDIIGEDGQPTGQKENVQFQPLMTKDGLIWVEPSKTTVEGLASLIDGLTARVSALENDRVTEQELADAVKVETDRATAAEEALGKRIDAIDFVDADELATAISGVGAKIPTNNNQLENGAGYQTADDVSAAITTGIADKADKAETLAGYGITDAYTKEEVNTELAKKAEKTALEALQARVEAFLDNTGAATEAIDTLQELITYIESHDDADISGILASIQAIENKLAGIDSTVAAYVTAAIDALNIGDYAKASELTALAGRVEALEAKPFETYATKTEVEAVDAKFQTVVANSDFETFKTENTQAISAARTGAVSDVEAKGYAVASEVETALAGKVDNGTIAHTSEGVAEGVTRDGTTLNIVVDAPTRAETAQMIADKIKDIAGEESIPAVKADLEAEIQRSTAKDNTHDAALATLQGEASVVGSVAEAKALAQKGVDDAADAALAVTNLTNGQVAQNKNDIAAVKDIVNGEENANSHAKRIAKLEAHDLAHGEEYTALNTKVGENTTAIAKKADADNVYTKGEADALLVAKANAADVYTKTETDKAIEDAIAGADLSTYAKVSDLEAIYKAGEGDAAATGILADEIARATAAEKANSDAIAALIGEDTNKTIREIAAEETAAIVAGADAKYDTLKEIADFIMNDETGAAAMANDIAALKTKVDTGDKSVSTYVSDAIAAIIQPKASAEVSVAEDGTLGIIEMNVNKLVQTTGDTLIIDGGSSAQ